MKKTNKTAQTTQTEPRMEYIVQWRWRMEPDKWQSIAPKRHKTLEDAKAELREMKRRNLQTRKAGKSTSVCGGIGFDCVHYSRYDVIGYRIRARQVTPWETAYEESEE